MAKKNLHIQLEEPTIELVKALAELKGWSFQSTLEKAALKGLKLVK